MKRTMLALLLVLVLASPAFAAAGPNSMGAYTSALAKAGVPAVCAKYGINFAKTFVLPATDSKAADYAGYTWEVRASYYDMGSGVKSGQSVWAYNGTRVEIWGFFEVVDFPPGELTAGYYFEHITLDKAAPGWAITFPSFLLTPAVPPTLIGQTYYLKGFYATQKIAQDPPTYFQN